VLTIEGLPEKKSDKLMPKLVGRNAERTLPGSAFDILAATRKAQLLMVDSFRDDRQDDW